MAFFRAVSWEDVKLSRRSFGVARNTHTAKRIGSIGQDHLRMWSVWSDLERIPRCIFPHALGVLACWTISWNLSKKCFVSGFRCCQVALKLQKCIQNQPSAKLLCLCSFPLTHSSCVAVCPTSQAFSALCQETIKKKKKSIFMFHLMPLSVTGLLLWPIKGADWLPLSLLQTCCVTFPRCKHGSVCVGMMKTLIIWPPRGADV